MSWADFSVKTMLFSGMTILNQVWTALKNKWRTFQNKRAQSELPIDLQSYSQQVYRKN